MPDRIAVSAADFVRNIGRWQAEALERPVSITYHGRKRLVLVSSRRYDEVRTVSAPANAIDDLVHSQFAWLASSVAEGYVLQSRDMEILRSNAVAAEMFGLTPAQLIGRKLIDLLPAAGAAMFIDHVQAAHRSGQSDSLNGEGAAFGDRSLTFRIAPLGEHIAVLITNHTERNRIEALKNVGDAVCHALEALPLIGGVQLNTFARVRASGSRFQEISGFSASELNDIRLTDIMVREQRRAFIDGFERAMASSQTQTVPVALIKKTGDNLKALASIAPVLAEGQPLEAVAMFSFATAA